MPLLSMQKLSLPRLSLGLCALAFAGPVLACGPDFPNSYLSASDTDLLKSPPGSFKVEIARLTPLVSTSLPWKTIQPARGTGWDADENALKLTRQSVLQTDVADVRAALTARGDAPGQVEKITNAYADCRQQLETWSRQRLAQAQTAAENAQMRFAGISTPDDPSPAPPPALTLPATLPTEFVSYFQGVLAWYNGQPDTARACWADLLALPPAERHYRSTWAAYMLGRAWTDEARRVRDGDGPDASLANATTKAVNYSRQVRSLAGEGFPDPLGLAEASLGWEAKAGLLSQNYAAALNLYLTQQSLGDDTALESLRRAATQAAQDSSPAQLLELAKNPAARGVLTAYLVAHGGSAYESAPANEDDELTRWADALDQAGVRDQPDADRFAWVSYEAGQFALAKQWAALAPEKSAVAEWVRAQLALRAGNLPEGEKHLRGALATASLSDSQKKLLLGELGRACLAQDHPQDALAAWIDAVDEEDASYVAERILKLDELQAYVDTHCPEAPVKLPSSTDSEFAAYALLSPALYDPNFTSDQVRADIRHLLARRLARADRPDVAEPYFPSSLRPDFHNYVADVRLGFDVSRPAAERAAAFWRAAQVARKDGMNLLGTELEPDWEIWGGIYETPADAQQRLALARTAVAGLFSPTPEEIARLAASPVPDKRFHYRYRAADLAWWAASLMPNDSDDTAVVLNEAGGWIKNRDPLAADKFYQALVIRCGNTALGKSAAQQHWFPTIASKT